MRVDAFVVVVCQLQSRAVVMIPGGEASVPWVDRRSTDFFGGSRVYQ